MFRRQGLWKTRKQLHQLPEENDRERVIEWWNLAEERFKTELGDPSWLTGYMAITMAFGAVAGTGTEVPPTAFVLATRTGYALRMFVDRFAIRRPLDVSMIDRSSIATLASRPRDPESGMLSIDAVSDAEDELLMPIATLASQAAIEPDRFGEVVSVEPAFWNACVSIATYQLQKNAQQAGLVRHGRQLDADTTEGFIRYGFVLRCLDEALGLEPNDPSADVENDDERPDAPEGTPARRPEDLPPHLRNRR